MRLRNPDFITLYTHENDTKTVPDTQAAHGDAFVDLTEADGARTLRLTADQTPVRPFLPYKGTIYYGLTVDPHSGDVYIADAIDFVQPGMIYRYSEDGELLDEFYSGIIPGAFCWK